MSSPEFNVSPAAAAQFQSDVNAELARASNATEEASAAYRLVSDSNTGQAVSSALDFDHKVTADRTSYQDASNHVNTAAAEHVSDTVAFDHGPIQGAIGL